MFPQNIVFKIKNEKLCVWLGHSTCQENCIFSSNYPLIQKFFTSLSSIKEMELPDINEKELETFLKKANNTQKPADNQLLKNVMTAETKQSSSESEEKTGSDHFKGKELASELEYLPCLIFPKQDLRIRKYNRLIKSTNNLTDEDILKKCRPFFEIFKLDCSDSKYSTIGSNC